MGFGEEEEEDLKGRECKHRASNFIMDAFIPEVVKLLAFEGDEG